MNKSDKDSHKILVDPKSIAEIARLYHQIKSLENSGDTDLYGPNALTSGNQTPSHMVQLLKQYENRVPPEIKSILNVDIETLQKYLTNKEKN